MNFFHTALWYLENTADYFVQMLPCMAAAALLCALLAASLTGCGSLLNREWYEVKE